MKSYFLLAAFLFFVLQPLPQWACGPDLYPDEARFALFRNGINGQDGFEPFYYSEYFLNSKVPDPQGKDYQTNCKEWQQVTGDKVALQDIYDLQYGTVPDSFLNAHKAKNWSHFKNNSFVQWMLKKKNKAYLTYFLIAKQMEYEQFYRGDEWTPQLVDTMNQAKLSLASTALEHVKKSKTNFLKVRYAFQALKTVYYVDLLMDKTPYLKAFEQYIMPGNSIVKGWGYFFYGMMQEDRIKRNTCLLRSFDLSEEKKVAAYGRIESKFLDELLLSNPGDQVAEIALAMKGIYTKGPAKQIIIKLHQVNPKSKYLPLLISREINKIEDWIWSYTFLGFTNWAVQYDGDTTFSFWNKKRDNDDSTQQWLVQNNRAKDMAYLNQFVGDIVAMDKSTFVDPDFLQLATAHLYNIMGKYEQAAALTRGIQLASGSFYYKQWKIEQIIALINTEDITLQKNKDILVNTLNAFETKNEAINTKEPYEENYNETEDDLFELYVMLSKKYQEQGDVITAGLFYNMAAIVKNVYDGWDTNWDDQYGQEQKKANSVTPKMNYKQIAFWDRYASPEQVYQLIAFKEKTNKSSFEQYLSPNIWPDNQVYLDLIGTKYMRMEQYHKALDVFKKMNASFWQDNYYYTDYLPATRIYNLTTYAPWEKQKENNYAALSKVLIVQDVVAIEDSLAKPGLSNEAKAVLYNKLGNCKLNMTKHGLFWMMLSYGNYARDNQNFTGNFYTYAFYPNSIAYGDNYYGGKSAQAAYDKAIGLSKNKETLAIAHLNKYLAAKLTYSFEDYYYGTDLKPDSSDLDMLRKRYANTNAYNTALSYCPDVK